MVSQKAKGCKNLPDICPEETVLCDSS